jgi:uracil-DNA glycosylase
VDSSSGGPGIRPLFIGEAPSPSTSRFGSHPLVGMTGARLAQWARLSPSEFHARAACVNLFWQVPQRWEAKAARRQAEWLWASITQPKEQVLDHYGAWVREVAVGAPVILLGERVAAAFGMASLRPYQLTQTAGPAVAVMPHPSGLNHHWNEAANVRRAERFLRKVMGTAGRTERQARLPMMGRAVMQANERAS